MINNPETHPWYLDAPIDDCHARIQIPGDGTVIVQGYNAALHAAAILAAINQSDKTETSSGV